MAREFAPIDGVYATDRRRQLGITIGALARILDVDPVTLGDYEAGTVSPTVELTGRWARALGCTPGRLRAELSRPYRVLDLDRPTMRGGR